MNFEQMNNDNNYLKELFWKCINAIILLNTDKNLTVKVGKKETGIPTSGSQELFYDDNKQALDFGYVTDFKNKFHRVTNAEKESIINTYHLVNNKMNGIETKRNLH